jgi:hypothetical protein
MDPATTAAPGLALSAPAAGGITIAGLSGKLDIARAPALREQLLGLLRPGSSWLVIDLSKVSHCDASGLAVLISTGRRARPPRRVPAPGRGSTAGRPEAAPHRTAPPPRRLPHRPGRNSQPAGPPRHQGLSDGGPPDPLAGGGLTVGQKLAGSPSA